MTFKTNAEILMQWATMVDALWTGLHDTHNPEARCLYELCLAQSARLGAMLVGPSSKEALLEHLTLQRQTMGRAYLEGKAGDKAESALTALSQAIESSGLKSGE